MDTEPPAPTWLSLVVENALKVAERRMPGFAAELLAECTSDHARAMLHRFKGPATDPETLKAAKDAEAWAAVAAKMLEAEPSRKRKRG